MRTIHTGGRCCCFIVPPDVLKKLALNADIDEAARQRFQATFVETTRLKTVREANRVAALMSRSSSARSVLAGFSAPARPRQQVYDCQHRQSLPGQQVADPASGDEGAKIVFNTTGKVEEFYRTVLGRNSIDNQGLDLVSSVHYRRDFNNAFWNGQQMVYGDGDGDIFTEFWRSADVIGHELTHGVTQYESGLRYEGESGALNESISDVVGAVFNQWLKGWTADNNEGWLVGGGIMGTRAKAAGKTCLRDMADPGNAHCLSPQPASFNDFNPAGDVHENSGIPNKAFFNFATALGGKAWEDPLKVWYAAATDRRLSSAATFQEFAGLTIDAANRLGGNRLAGPAKAAWTAVDLPLAGA